MFKLKHLTSLLLQVFPSPHGCVASYGHTPKRLKHNSESQVRAARNQCRFNWAIIEIIDIFIEASFRRGRIQSAADYLLVHALIKNRHVTLNFRCFKLSILTMYFNKFITSKSCIRRAEDPSTILVQICCRLPWSLWVRRSYWRQFCTVFNASVW